MIDVKNATEEDGLHLAYILHQLKTADRLIHGLTVGGIQIDSYHTEASSKAREWLNQTCKDVATVLSPKTEVVSLPKRKTPPTKPTKSKKK